MRKPICLHCGEKLTHFGRGVKHRVQKFRGGWIHVDCYYTWQYERTQKKKQYKRLTSIPIYQLAAITRLQGRIRKELTA